MAAEASNTHVWYTAIIIPPREEVAWLFLDLNSYFASVQQQVRPELRGRPIGVVPVMAETTRCIAASYEAKAFGVKTGTNVAEARILCPGTTFMEARPALYVRYHELSQNGGVDDN